MALCVLLSLPLQGEQDSATSVFRGGVQMVGISLTVRGQDGHLVTALSADDFRLFVDGRPVAIDLYSNEARPLAVAVLFSTVRGELLPRTRAVGDALLGALDDEDVATIGSYANEVAVGPALTADKRTLRRALNEELWPGWGNPVATAVDGGRALVASSTAKRAVVVIGSDLRDSCIGGAPCVTVPSAIASLSRAEVMVYGLWLRDPPGAPSDRPVRRMAYETGGGYAEVADDADLAATMARVVDELRHEYLIGFVPIVRDDRRHDLRVEVARPGLVTRARRTFRMLAP